jgi:hypothetical protein
MTAPENVRQSSLSLIFMPFSFATALERDQPAGLRKRRNGRAPDPMRAPGHDGDRLACVADILAHEQFSPSRAEAMCICVCAGCH